MEMYVERVGVDGVLMEIVVLWNGRSFGDKLLVPLEGTQAPK